MLRGASLTDSLSRNLTLSCTEVVPNSLRAFGHEDSGRHFIIILFTEHWSEWGPCPILSPSHNPVLDNLRFADGTPGRL
jgi:hypothetical protein